MSHISLFYIEMPDSHSAPYAVLRKSRRAQLQVNAQFDAKRSRKVLRRKKTKVLSSTISLLDQRFRALNGFEARRRHTFERAVVAEHARAMTSSERIRLGAKLRSLVRSRLPLGLWRGALLSNLVHPLPLLLFDASRDSPPLLPTTHFI